MARARALPVLCALVALCCAPLLAPRAFLPGPRAPCAPQADMAAAAIVGGAALGAMPGAAGAFYYDGKEYFDITFGISPLAWG
eukprot:CAMPEP_0179135604 /NCGR_PEP_ID=MMETSP0796-20121207/64574_1 /TAXON_ID=73915 /ORGANISM="Pyrodinium bahamense, Strain pbaha01" /LENGTH=82 /DNA_ID=CAMNT_0020834637 /DNA_START=68 /DNA_END=312 /DNA_ORIENTATION=+